MKAHEARKVTNERIFPERVAPWLELIYKIVEKTANEGKDSIYNPMHNLGPNGDDSVPFDVRDHVIAQLRSDGYKYIHHDNPDIGNQCSVDYDTLEW